MKNHNKSMLVQVARDGVKHSFPERSDDKKKQRVLCEADGQSYRWVLAKGR